MYVDIVLSPQSSLSIFAQNYRLKSKNTYFFLQKKYLRIYADSFGAKKLRDDCGLSALGPIIDF